MSGARPAPPIAAPLFAVPGSPLRGAAEWVETRGGARLRAALFPSDGDPHGSVIVSPGRTEPIEKYAEAIADLQRRGFVVLVHDWRGQGLSDGIGYRGRLRRGHARGWRPFLADHARLLDVFADRLPRPWIGLGHSMGGGLLLLAMAEGESRLAGACLSGAMLGLRLGGRPPWLVGAAAEVMALGGQAERLAPSASRRLNGSDDRYEGEALTHDALRWHRFQVLLERAPELEVGDPTWGWVQFAMTLMARLDAPGALEAIAMPVTLVGAGRDVLVVNAAQRRAAERLPQGRYVEIEDAFHELLMETDARRAAFWRAFEDLAARAGA